MLALSTPALADITPDQLWAQMQATVADAGGTLTAQENRRGGSLVLQRGQIDLGDGALVLLPDITLQPTPDRGVSVELPARFPLTLDVPPGPNVPDRPTMTVSAPDLKLVIRSLGEQATDFDLSATSITASLDPYKMTQGSSPGPADFFLALAVADLDLSHRHSLAKPDILIDTLFSLGTLHAEMRIDVPADAIKGDMALDLSAIAGHIAAQIPADAGPMLAQVDQTGDPGLPTMIALLDLGMGIDAGATHGPVSLTFDAPDETTGPNALAFSMANGNALFTLDRTGMVYDAGTGPTRVYYRGNDPDIPLPEIEASLDDYRTTLKLGFPGGGIWGSPAGKTNSIGADNLPDNGTWAVLYRLTGLAVSPQIWDLGDPGKVIPRDPISFVADLTGTYLLDPKALAPDWQPTPTSPPPFKDISIKLAELLVSGAGVSFTGTGDVSLDMSQMVSMDDLPLAKGSLSFVTLGANAMLDRLDKLGLIAPEELQAARFGLLFLGRIEGGADRLVSKVDFDGAGITLNGQKIR